VDVYPRWIRLGEGRIKEFHGASVLDLRDVVRAMQDAGECGGAS